MLAAHESIIHKAFVTEKVYSVNKVHSFATCNQVLSTYDVSHITRLSPFLSIFRSCRESLGTRLVVLLLYT